MSDDAVRAEDARWQVSVAHLVFDEVHVVQALAGEAVRFVIRCHGDPSTMCMALLEQVGTRVRAVRTDGGRGRPRDWGRLIFVDLPRWNDRGTAARLTCATD